MWTWKIAVEQLEKNYLADKKIEIEEGGPISKKIYSIEDNYSDLPVALQKRIDESFQNTNTQKPPLALRKLLTFNKPGLKESCAKETRR